MNNPNITSFERILKEASNVELIEFREFLHDSFNNENLTFYIEVEQFKTDNENLDHNEIRVKAQELYDKFFVNTSPYELNVPGFLKRSITEKLNENNTNVNCFDEIQKYVVKMMAEDTYPKFLESDRYKKVMTAKENKKKSKQMNKQLRHSDSFATFTHFLEGRERRSTESSLTNKSHSLTYNITSSPTLVLKSNSTPNINNSRTPGIPKKKRFLSFTDVTSALKSKRRSPTQDEMKIYRKSFDAYHSISENEISLKILAEDTVLYTRTSNNMSCKDFLTKQLKKIPHDPSKTYGIYLVKANVWLEDSLPLSYYQNLLDNPKEIVEVAPKVSKSRSSSSSSLTGSSDGSSVVLSISTLSLSNIDKEWQQKSL